MIDAKIMGRIPAKYSEKKRIYFQTLTIFYLELIANWSSVVFSWQFVHETITSRDYDETNIKRLVMRYVTDIYIIALLITENN